MVRPLRAERFRSPPLITMPAPSPRRHCDLIRDAPAPEMYLWAVCLVSCPWQCPGAGRLWCGQGQMAEGPWH